MNTFLNTKNLENLQNDNIFTTTEVKSVKELTNLSSSRKLQKVIISNGKIVNIVSNSYGFLPNDVFFGQAESRMQETGFKYAKRSINRDDASFAVDYILHDENAIVTVKNGIDKVVPMLRLVNSYDGSNKTTGHFGVYRQVCSNGLHVAETKLQFSLKHRGNIIDVVLPYLNELVEKFINNEYATINRKFEVLAERPIANLESFVKLVADTTKLFKFESSEKNPEPSKNARTIIATIEKEAALLGEQPNLWLGYNAFNELLHDGMKKSFATQKAIDARLFNTVMEMAETN